MKNQTVRDVQNRILEVMKFIDYVCRENDIEYFIMGGTALGAIRHGGFIPWDDDLDIFMTPQNYEKFRKVFNTLKNDKFVLQEWKIVDEFLEYAKVRMNGTTFIEEVYKDRKDMHHGIYVDIMILHKCPKNKMIQKIIYYASKYVTLVALSQRNWRPKSDNQKFALYLLRILPNKILCKISYRLIYKYVNLGSDFSYCYFITKAKFTQGIFESNMFNKPRDIEFEETKLMGPTDIVRYLEYRYGNYMKLPSLEEQKEAVHAEIYDTELGYENYL